MKPARACPICPDCGSKKFERLESDGVKVQCANCKSLVNRLYLLDFEFVYGKDMERRRH